MPSIWGLRRTGCGDEVALLALRHAEDQRLLRNRDRDVLRRAWSATFSRALYAGEDVSIAIETRAILDGSLPDRALRLVREWAKLHREELEADWRLAREGQPLKRIPPLP
jgi:hypothetical protein